MDSSPTSPQVLHERLVARLRVRHLRLIAAMGHHSTLADAAKEVGLTQPAASQMLLDLEQLLGMQLFERHRRGVRATEAGRFLSDQSVQVLAALRHTADGLAALAAGRHRPLRIGAIGAAMTALLRPGLARRRAQLPGLELHVQEGTPDTVHAGLHGGSFDIGLLRWPAVPLHAPWTWQALLEDEIAVVVDPRHPLARRRAVALVELSSLPWCLPQPGFATYELFIAACRATGFTPVPAPWQCLSVDLLPAMTEDRQTVAAVPRSLVAPLLSRGVVRELRLKDAVSLPPLGALWNAQQPHPGIRGFLQLLEAQ